MTRFHAVVAALSMAFMGLACTGEFKATGTRSGTRTYLTCERNAAGDASCTPMAGDMGGVDTNGGQDVCVDADDDDDGVPNWIDDDTDDDWDNDGWGCDQDDDDDGDGKQDQDDDDDDDDGVPDYLDCDQDDKDQDQDQDQDQDGNNDLPEVCQEVDAPDWCDYLDDGNDANDGNDQDQNGEDCPPDGKGGDGPDSND